MVVGPEVGSGAYQEQAYHLLTDTHAVSPVSWSWIRSVSVQKQPNYCYENCQTAFGSMKVCNCRLDNCNSHRTCKKLTSNETAENPVTSTCVFTLTQKMIIWRADPCITNKLRDIFNWTICRWYWNVATYMYIYMGSWWQKLKSSRLSYNRVVSLTSACFQ
jgi:hypothetical protein